MLLTQVAFALAASRVAHPQPYPSGMVHLLGQVHRSDEAQVELGQGTQVIATVLRSRLRLLFQGHMDKTRHP